MSNLNQILSQISIAGWISICSAVIVLAFIWWSRANKPAFFDFLMNFPIRLFGPIGKLRELRKHTTNLNSNTNWNNGMPPQERTLCMAYMDKMGKVTSQEDFDNATEYLDVTGQGSVKPMGFWIWSLLLLLTMGEAAGTGALLSEFVSTNVTSNEAVYFTWGIALILAVVLLQLTHKAGTAYFEHKTFKDILGENDREAKPDGYVDGVDDVPFSGDQLADRGKPQAVRFYARLEKKKARGSLGYAVAALVVLLIIMSSVFFARMYGIEKTTTTSIAQTTNAGVGSGNPFAADQEGTQANVPPDVAKAERATQDKKANEIKEYTVRQGMWASILLAVFYLIVQMVGFAISARRSFFQRGEDAYKLTGGCASYDEYMAKNFSPYATRAETRLSDLRAHYARINEAYSRKMPSVTFFDFFHTEKQNSRNSRKNEYATRKETPVSAMFSDGSDQGVQTHTAIASPSAEQVDLHAIAKEILGVPDREGRQAKLRDVLSRLDTGLHEQLKSVMAEVKENQENEAAVAAFEGLI